MSTLGQKPSQQDATVQNQHNEPQETADLLRSASILGILNCTTSKSTTTLAACARMVPRALPTLSNVEGENTDASSHNQKLGVSKCFNQKRSISTSANIDLHTTPRRGPEAFRFKVHRGALYVGSANPQARGSGFHTGRSTHGFAEEFLICIRDLSLLSSRDLTWKRNGSKSIGKEFFKGTLKVGTSGHFQPNRTAETRTSNIVRKQTNRKTDLCTPHCH